MTRLSVRSQRVLHRCCPHFRCSRRLKVLSCDEVLMSKREKLCKLCKLCRREKLDFPSVSQTKPITCVIRVSGFADLFDLDHFIHSLKSESRSCPTLLTRGRSGNCTPWSLSAGPAWRTTRRSLCRSYSNTRSAFTSNPLLISPPPTPMTFRPTPPTELLFPSSHLSPRLCASMPVSLCVCMQIVYIHESDSRLANNSPRVPSELQKLRCRVQYRALRFSPTLRSLSETIIHRLQAQGPFLALHLRYEIDMLAFTGCSQGCTSEEERRMTKLRCVVATLHTAKSI